MASWVQKYTVERNRIMSDLDAVARTEKRVHDELAAMALAAAPKIERDWEHAFETLPHWIVRAPRQRGRSSSGKGVPWSEVAERVPLAHMVVELVRRYGADIRFPALPSGGDLRFLIQGAFVHFDAKACGPTDSRNEVVVPPYQVSGDGRLVKLNGEDVVDNDVMKLVGRRKGGRPLVFYPSLPPVYVYAGETAMCVTSFLKVVYDVKTLGDQPLLHFTLATVPNGLLLTERNLVSIYGLFGAGKDAAKTPAANKRVRVMFAGLTALDAWRVTKIHRVKGLWVAESGVW